VRGRMRTISVDYTERCVELTLRRVLDRAPSLKALTKNAWRAGFRCTKLCTRSFVNSRRSNSNRDFSIFKNQYEEVGHMHRFIQRGMAILFASIPVARMVVYEAVTTP
jgi:hypothetical protein